MEFITNLDLIKHCVFLAQVEFHKVMISDIYELTTILTFLLFLSF